MRRQKSASEIGGGKVAAVELNGICQADQGREINDQHDHLLGHEQVAEIAPVDDRL
jgi:hypothetical protein